MAWRTANVKEQRVQFVVAVSRKEKTLTKLCQEFEIARPTGYRWWKRYQNDGIAGIEERSRRPIRSPGRTPAGIERRVVELRQQRPDWGARKIQYLLGKEQVELPVGTIHRILLRHDLVREQDRHEAEVQRVAESALADGFLRDPKAGIIPWGRRPRFKHIFRHRTCGQTRHRDCSSLQNSRPEKWQKMLARA
jgi:transposase-like protein